MREAMKISITLTMEFDAMTEQQAVSTLAAKIAEQGTVVESVIAGLTSAIKNAKDVSPEILALVTEVEAQTAALADAVVVNTPTPDAQPMPGGGPTV
jgi:hypothetical protein